MEPVPNEGAPGEIDQSMNFLKVGIQGLERSHSARPQAHAWQEQCFIHCLRTVTTYSASSKVDGTSRAARPHKSLLKPAVNPDLDRAVLWLSARPIGTFWICDKPSLKALFVMYRDYPVAACTSACPIHSLPSVDGAPAGYLCDTGPGFGEKRSGR